MTCANTLLLEDSSDSTSLSYTHTIKCHNSQKITVWSRPHKSIEDKSESVDNATTFHCCYYTVLLVLCYYYITTMLLLLTHILCYYYAATNTYTMLLLYYITTMLLLLTHILCYYHSATVGCYYYTVI